MGYAFLYGVFGSLIGSSIGAFLYTQIMKPAIGTADAATVTRNFWLMFTALDVVAAVGLILFARRFTADTPETNRSANGVMAVVYAAIFLLGGWFLYSAFSVSPVQYRTAVQSVIFLALGAGGFAVTLKSRGRDK
jgi:hypothetical protein